MDAHRVIGGDGPVEEAPARTVRVLRSEAGERPALLPLGQNLVLLGDEVGLRADGSEHLASAADRVARATGNERPSILPAMQSPQEARQRARSPFVAAVLSLFFPGLGHAYAGAYHRALGFAAPPILAVALLAGVVLRAEPGELFGLLLDSVGLAQRLRPESRRTALPLAGDHRCLPGDGVPERCRV